MDYAKEYDRTVEQSNKQQDRIAELERQHIDSQAQLMVERRELLEKLAAAQATIQRKDEALKAASEFLDGIRGDINPERGYADEAEAGIVETYRITCKALALHYDRSCLDAMLEEARRQQREMDARICLALNANSNDFERPNGVACANAIRQAAERSE